MVNSTNAQSGKSARTDSPELTPTNVAAVALLAGSYYVPKDVIAPGARRVIVQIAGCAAAFGVFMLGVRGKDVVTGAEQHDDPAENEFSVPPTEDQFSREEVLKKLEADQPMGGVESSSTEGRPSRLTGFAMLGGLCALVGASIWATLRFDKWAVGKLRERGVKYPNSLWGAVNFVAGVATLAFDD